MKKISLVKNVHMDQKWSHAKVLGRYFEVYGQLSPITPEAGEKKAPFLYVNFQIFPITLRTVILAQLTMMALG